MVVDAGAVRRMPKVELHCHLEGCVRASTLIELADRHHVTLPTRRALALYHFADLDAFVSVYELACGVMRSASDFALVTYETLEDAFRTSNVRYREMFVSPTAHPGTPYPVMLAGIVDGIRAAEHDYGVTARVIPSIRRQGTAAEAREVVEMVVAHPHEYVVGIGMDGPEAGAPPGRFVDAYTAAGRAGLRRTAHVAHEGPAAYVDECLRVLGCDRIDHGYHVLDDPALVARLRDAGTAFVCSSATPPLWGWPRELEHSPIRSMIAAGLTVTLNTDDPAMLHVDLASEMTRVATAWSLTEAQLERIVADAVDAAWCQDAARAAVRP